MANVKFYLKRPKADSTAIVLYFRYPGKTLVFFTGKSIDTIDWNSEKGRPRKLGGRADLAALHKVLDNMEAQIKALYLELEQDGEMITNDKLTTLLNERIGRTEAKKKDEFFEFAREIVKKKKSLGMAYKSFQSTINTLEKFNPKLSFNSFDLQLYDKYLAYLMGEKYSKNYIGKQISNIKAILNEATEKGLNKNMAFKSSKFKSFKEEVYNIYLNTDELKKLQNYDFSEDPKLERVRDLFLVGCHTGLRFSDFSKINKSNIKDGMYLIKDTQKTGARVIIPLSNTVKEILIKYDWVLPKISGQKMNDYLKIIGEKAKVNEVITQTRTEGGVKVTREFKKYKLMTTHTARRSMATNMYTAKIPIPSIMMFTGHSTVKQFLSYIKVSEQEVAESLIEHDFFKN